MGHVPHEDLPVNRRRNCLIVRVNVLNSRDWRLVQPLRCDERLGLTTYLPKFDFTVEASCEQILAVERRAHASDALGNDSTVPALDLDSTYL